MYLIEIDENGLVKDCPTNSGWKAIESFRNLDLKTLTVVALSVDYLSPFSHYSDLDRPYRAVEEVFGDRNKIDFDKEEIKRAFEKYKELQFNSDLQQERINNEIKIRILRKIEEANDQEDDVSIEKLRKALNNHEQTIERFNQRFDKKEAVKKAVTSNGYELSRIESDIKSRKNSKFVNPKGFVNPNKLKLEK